MQQQPGVTGVEPLGAEQLARLDRVAAAEMAGIQDLPTDEPLDTRRRARVEATRPELLGQPAAILTTLADNAAAVTATVDRVAASAPARVTLVGAGDSLAVAQAARYAVETMSGVPCEAVQSLEFAKYVDPVPARSLVIALSSSGETTRTVEALLRAQAAGSVTVAVTNSRGSTLEELSDSALLVAATRVGWPTQSSSAALALLLGLAVELGRRRSHPLAREWGTALTGLPEQMAGVLPDLEPAVAEIAAREREARMYLYSGAGPNWATAVVGAAKLKECAPDHAVAVQLEEYHHYNSQKAGEPLWIYAPTGHSVPRALDTAREARRFGGRVYVATTVGETAFDGLADGQVRLPQTPELLSPLLYFLPAQLMGYATAMAKFAAAAQACT